MMVRRILGILYPLSPDLAASTTITRNTEASVFVQSGRVGEVEECLGKGEP